MSLEPVQLYGGAITTVIPKGFLDASLLRQVPDAQEVYVNSRDENEQFNDGLQLNESIIVDLLQPVAPKDLKEALKVHVEDIVSLNETTKDDNQTFDWEVLQVDQVQEKPCCIAAQYTVKKWGKEDSKQETVVSCVGLIRLQEFQVDVVITVNAPLQGEAQQRGSALIADPHVQAAYSVLQEMLKQFVLVDKSLFA
ncbi:hypothetical protein NCAS_0A12420 [Naumovozyma castellii]|uniref:Mog1p/PsbP-like protein n=1 Tax=Naumovozyma castellii TaxID=27288 RepID=G0V8K1_NAUCA|nr:hypothetical protein NCAS_0A12420 [Naumovozyma castellii CBS 4309]CCC67800.1 hypothetical protein NCAS_0A12420 [Naumovozyma castellii CBS 4309]